MKPLDFQAVNDAPVFVNVAGREYRFPILTRKQLAELSAKWLARERAELLEAAQQTQADPADRLERLRALQEEARGIGFVLARCRCFTCQSDILRASMPGEDEPALGPMQMAELCLAICGWQTDEEGEEADPKAG